MSNELIPYNRQCLDDDDIRCVVEALRSPYLTTGPEAAKFEQEICDYVGAKHAVVCSNGTAALHLAMLALGLGTGDCVITTPITFVADANAARYVGADVRFADVLPGTANLDPASLRQSLHQTDNVKAVIPVHFGGQPADMEALAALASEFEFSLVEDACHALGAEYRDSNGGWHRIGSCDHSDMTVFSFHPIKNITTGEGGCITTNNTALYHKLRLFRSHGVTKDAGLITEDQQGFTEIDDKTVQNPWYYEMQLLGFNYRICDFQCALGRSQLKKLDRYVERRAELDGRYRTLISQRLDGVVLPLDYAEGVRHAHHLFVVRMPFDRMRGGRANLMNFLMQEGISTQVHYLPVYRHPYYKRYLNEPVHAPASEEYYSQCLSLPLFPSMNDDVPEQVVGLLEKAVHENLDA